MKESETKDRERKDIAEQDQLDGISREEQPKKQDDRVGFGIGIINCRNHCEKTDAKRESGKRVIQSEAELEIPPLHCVS